MLFHEISPDSITWDRVKGPHFGIHCWHFISKQFLNCRFTSTWHSKRHYKNNSSLIIGLARLSLKRCVTVLRILRLSTFAFVANLSLHWHLCSWGRFALLFLLWVDIINDFFFPFLVLESTFELICLDWALPVLDVPLDIQNWRKEELRIYGTEFTLWVLWCEKFQ